MSIISVGPEDLLDLLEVEVLVWLVEWWVEVL